MTSTPQTSTSRSKSTVAKQDDNELTQKIVLNELSKKEIVTTKEENKNEIQEETKKNDKKEDNDEIKDKTEEKGRKDTEDKAVQCKIKKEKEMSSQNSSLKRKSGMMTDSDDSASSESLKKMKMSEDSSMKESTPDKEPECTHCIQAKMGHQQLRKEISDVKARLAKEKQSIKIKVQSQKLSTATKTLPKQSETEMIRKLPNSQRTAKQNFPEDEL